jgi:hypothetical protein
MSDDVTAYDTMRAMLADMLYEFEIPDILEALVAEVEAMDWPEGEIARKAQTVVLTDAGIVAGAIDRMVEARKEAK